MTTKRAAIYCRISDDKEGRELGVTRQREDCAALAERLGAEVHRVYEDNDISASTRSRKPRPDYQQLLADARSGAFSLVIAYTSGRITRRPREHEDLIELAEQYGIQFAYVASPSFDLNTSAGRRVARILAANDAGEAEDISERVARAVKQRAERGEYHGGPIPFGQQAIREVVNGRERVVGFQLHAEHAEWVREAARRLLAGETVYGICVDWNSQGRTSSEGKPWHPRTLKRVMTKPSVTGLREYEGQLYPAPWGPVIDRADWERLCELLTDPDRRISESNRRKYALSGLLFCHCGNRMTSTSEKRIASPTFECAKIKTSSGGCGRTRIVMRPLEEYIFEQVFIRADSPELRQPIEPDDPAAELRQAILDDERRLNRLEDEYDQDEITKLEYRRRRAKIMERMEANIRARDNATRKQVRSNLPNATDLRAQWDTRDDVWKRTVLGMFIERIEIGPHPAGVQSGPPFRRKGETEQEWRERFKLQQAQVFAQRVRVVWWV